MRRIAVIIFITAALVPGSAFCETENADSLSLSLSWDLGLKLEFEHHFNELISIKGGAGTYLFLPMFLADGSIPFVQELLLMFNPFESDSSFQAGAGIGIPVSSIIFYQDEQGSSQTGFMFAPGAELYCGFLFEGGSQLRLHIGTGYPVFFDAGDWRAGSNISALGLWPDLDLEFSWKM